MWIRSQDQQTLIKSNKITIGYDYPEYTICADDIIVGRYATMKKCLKILDDIHNKVVVKTPIYFMPED